MMDAGSAFLKKLRVTQNYLKGSFNMIVECVLSVVLYVALEPNFTFDDFRAD